MIKWIKNRLYGHLQAEVESLTKMYHDRVQECNQLRQDLRKERDGRAKKARELNETRRAIKRLYESTNPVHQADGRLIRELFVDDVPDHKLFHPENGSPTPADGDEYI